MLRFVNSLLTNAYSHLANRLKLYSWLNDYFHPQIKVDDMVRACNTYAGDEKFIKNVNTEREETDGRIKFNWILEK
jgi:hypothetical protein